MLIELLLSLLQYLSLYLMFLILSLLRCLAMYSFLIFPMHLLPHLTIALNFPFLFLCFPYPSYFSDLLSSQCLLSSSPTRFLLFSILTIIIIIIFFYSCVLTLTTLRYPVTLFFLYFILCVSFCFLCLLFSFDFFTHPLPPPHIYLLQCFFSKVFFPINVFYKF